jgi:hypothetical protein
MVITPTAMRDAPVGLNEGASLTDQAASAGFGLLSLCLAWVMASIPETADPLPDGEGIDTPC